MISHDDLKLIEDHDEMLLDLICSSIDLDNLIKSIASQANQWDDSLIIVEAQQPSYQPNS